LVTILVVSGVSGGGSILVHALITGAAAGMVTLLLALVPGRVPARQGIEIGGRRYVAIGGSADVARQVFGPPPTGSMPPA
jgi:hypothetical protein